MAADCKTNQTMAKNSPKPDVLLVFWLLCQSHDMWDLFNVRLFAFLRKEKRTLNVSTLFPSHPHTPPTSSNVLAAAAAATTSNNQPRHLAALRGGHEGMDTFKWDPKGGYVFSL